VSGELLRLACGGLHPDRVRSLLATHGTAQRTVAAIQRGKVKVNDRVRAAIDVSAAERRKELARLGAACILPRQAGYPERLAMLPDAPTLLFVRGSIPSQPAVAVVGTRKCTSYGRRLATAYGTAIAEAGWVLVSGLARGIDGAAHRGTVNAGGKGVAVLGCGLDVAYPREHAGLADSLLEGEGAVVSEYPPGTPPEAWRFPPRNRVISGLSQAVVVVEAGVKGGALITAATALEQGVPVFAVPGDVGRDTSRGTNLLIRDGAHPVLDPDDLLEALSLVLGPRRSTRAVLTGSDDVTALIGPGASLDEIAARARLSPGETVALVGRWVAEGSAGWEGSSVVPVSRRHTTDR